MHLSSVIPANDTRESVFGLRNFPHRGRGSNRGPLASEASALTTELPRLPICNTIKLFLQNKTNSSACTTTELSILLTSCLTAIKNHVIKYCTTVYERNGKKIFWSIKNSGEILNKLKSRGFLASGLSTYDFSTVYTTLPHNLIKEKLTE